MRNPSAATVATQHRAATPQRGHAAHLRRWQVVVNLLEEQGDEAALKSALEAQFKTVLKTEPLGKRLK